MENIQQNIVESIDIHNRKLCKIMSKDFLKIDISIPNAQRIRDDDKVNDIINYQLERLRTKGYCNIMGLINIHYCKSTNELYLVDGQHRYEAIRKIDETNNIPVSFELVSVDTMEELKENYKIINKNTPLPEFPETIDKNIPEDVAKYFKTNFPNIWSKNSRARRPHIYFNYFQEALGVIVDELNIKNKDDLLKLMLDRNETLSKWQLENYPDSKKINTDMLKKCQDNAMYFGLYKHVSDDFRYEWVRDIIRHSTGKDIKQNNTQSKKKTISKSLKTTIWDKYIGKDKRSTYCICCVNVEIKIEDFHAGHIVSESSGGQTNDTNLLPVCSQCNTSMGSTNMNVFVKTNFPDNYNNFINRKYKSTTAPKFLGFL
jgi:hypothetical protein